jgi:peptide/nickel transport system permease protein
MKNLLYALSLIIGIFTITFIVFNVIPTNPARIILGPLVPEEVVKDLEKKLGLDQPLYVQFLRELKSFFTLNFGKSFFSEKEVGKEVSKKFVTSFKLIFLTLIIAIIISYLLNLISFYYPKFKNIVNITKFGIILPTFVSSITIAILIIILFPKIPIRYDPENFLTLILPSLILSFYPTALLTHIFHQKINEISNSTYFKSAASLGFSKNYLFHQICLRASLVSLISSLVNILSVAFFSTIIIEIIFTIPGIGSLLLDAVMKKDFNMLKGIVFLNSAFFIIINALAEVIYPKIDPRIKHG